LHVLGATSGIDIGHLARFLFLTRRRIQAVRVAGQSTALQLVVPQVAAIARLDRGSATVAGDVEGAVPRMEEGAARFAGTKVLGLSPRGLVEPVGCEIIDDGLECTEMREMRVLQTHGWFWTVLDSTMR
jgi:hypothetical protein